jgi:sn-glycerol 3-phosphate transport system ATP-binding protein
MYFLSYNLHKIEQIPLAERGKKMASITFQKVTKKFGDNIVIENLDLEIKDGSFTVLVGPSGCGKTTLLRMIAGIGPQTSGSVLIDGKDVTQIAPGKRGVAMVFQNYAIYPTMSVRDNIEFGLKNNKIPKEERDRLVKEAVEKVGMTEYLDRQPGTLSGGQRQRIALARAIVKNPSVFLMDEPLSNLDAKLRVQMRVELIELHNKLKTTFVYVTHDQVEAMSMADTIVLMNKGKIMQEAKPTAMYRDPDNLFTARFIGSPAMNMKKLNENGEILGFRPEKAKIGRTPFENEFSAKGTIIAKETLGSEVQYSVRDKDSDIFIVKTEDEGYEMGNEVYTGCDYKNIYVFDSREQRVRDKDPRYPEYMEKVRALKL